MPRTAKDYESFDAYVSSILLKRDNREGMFAGWTQDRQVSAAGCSGQFLLISI